MNVQASKTNTKVDNRKSEIIFYLESRLAELTRLVEEAEKKFTTDYEEQGRALHGNIDQAEDNLVKLRSMDEPLFTTWHPSVKSIVEKTEQLLDRTAELLPSLVPESIGWATGQAKQVESDSEGWAEGMGVQEEDSAGWAEGQGKREASSIGWAEGVSKPGD